MSALRRVRELPDFDRLCEMQTKEAERGPISHKYVRRYLWTVHKAFFVEGGVVGKTV